MCCDVAVIQPWAIVDGRAAAVLVGRRGLECLEERPENARKMSARGESSTKVGSCSERVRASGIASVGGEGELGGASLLERNVVARLCTRECGGVLQGVLTQSLYALLNWK